MRKGDDMEKHAQTAYDALKKIGAPVLPGDNWGPGSHFEISGEDNGTELWADYYNEFNPAETDDFGVSNKIMEVLTENGLYAEWINAGVLGVYDA